MSTDAVEVRGDARYDRKLVKELLAARARREQLQAEFRTLVGMAFAGTLEPVVAEQRRRVGAWRDRNAERAAKATRL